MLRFSRLIRNARGPALRTQLFSLVEQTATVCSVCSALIRKAQQQSLQQQLQQQPEELWRSRPFPNQKLLLLPKRQLQQNTTIISPDKAAQLKGKAVLDIINSAHWGYEGQFGVNHWADVYPSCGGKSQSPVDIVTADAKMDSSLGTFTFTNFNNVDGLEWDLANNGHSAQVTYVQGDLRVSGGGLGNEYRVAQFHFHWGSQDSLGSEHMVDGTQFPMEMHIVTYNLKHGDMANATNFADGLAVLGMLFEVNSEDNANFAALIQSLSEIKVPGMHASLSPVNLETLMPSTTDSFWRYSGSLTTPPCTEVVTWTIFDTSVPISSSQMEVFRSLKTAHSEPLVNNFRPVQALNGRKVTKNF